MLLYYSTVRVPLDAVTCSMGMGPNSAVIMSGVREHTEGNDVALVQSANGRLAIRATNEGGNNETLVDLWDVIDWLRMGPASGQREGGFSLPVVPVPPAKP